MKHPFAILAVSLCLGGCCDLAYGPTQCRLQEAAAQQQEMPPPQALMPAAGPASAKPLRVGGEWPEGQALMPPPPEQAAPAGHERWLHL